MKQIIIASTSSLHGQDYLAYLTPTLKTHFKAAKSILFVPFARPGGITHETYTNIAKTYFNTLHKKVNGLHEFSDKLNAIDQAEAIFVGGGNTFVLVKTLHDLGLMQPLRQAVLAGTPYLGTSAGSNICGISMQTTNDMPIVYPSSFKTLGVIPFNINPHYLDPNPDGTHMGETRQTRIKEYHAFNNVPVVGLREGSWLEVHDHTISLKGTLTARVFKANLPAIEADNSFDFEQLN